MRHHDLSWLTRLLRSAAFPVAVLTLSGCDTRTATPSADASGIAASGSPVPAAAASGADAGTPSEAASTAAGKVAKALDFGALVEREAPERLLRFYAEALRQGQWSIAALAWDSDAHMTGEALQKAYQRDFAPDLAVGKGTTEGAAGSMFYEAPAVLTFGTGGDSVRGTMTLRRANDIPGASEEELAWRIERSTIGPQL